MGADAVVLRGMDHSAPQPQPMSRKRFVGLEPQLAADHVELVALRARDVVVRLGEIARSCRPSRDRERARRTRSKDRSDIGCSPCWIASLPSRPALSPCTSSSGHGPPRGTNRNRAAVRSASVLSSALRKSFERTRGRSVIEIEQRAVAQLQARRNQRLNSVSSFGRRISAATAPSSAIASAMRIGGEIGRAPSCRPTARSRYRRPSRSRRCASRDCQALEPSCGGGHARNVVFFVLAKSCNSPAFIYRFSGLNSNRLRRHRAFGVKERR